MACSRRHTREYVLNFSQRQNSMKFSRADGLLQGSIRTSVSETEFVSETLDLINPLTLLVARQIFIERCILGKSSDDRIRVYLECTLKVVHAAIAWTARGYFIFITKRLRKQTKNLDVSRATSSYHVSTYTTTPMLTRRF